MNKLETINAKYRLADNPHTLDIELIPVFDDVGSKVDQVLRQLIISTKDSELTLELINTIKALRSRLITDIQPSEFNPRVAYAADTAVEEIKKCHLGVNTDTQQLFDSIENLCNHVKTIPSPIGSALEDCIREIGEENCAVLTSSKVTQSSVSSWFQSKGISTQIFCKGDLSEVKDNLEQLYVVGPPIFYPTSLLYSPVSSQLTFLMPSWFKMLDLPQSPMDEFSEGFIKLKPKKHPMGQSHGLESDERVETTPLSEQELLPQPYWQTSEINNTDCGENDIKAHLTILSGDFACYLSEQDEVQTFDPNSTTGSRLSRLQFDMLCPGAFLILRHDEYGQGSLYEEAINSFGDRSHDILSTQSIWKEALRKLISSHNKQQVEELLRNAQIHAYTRAEEWVATDVDRPQRSMDFRLLLRLLNLPDQRYFDNATQLRSKRLSLGREVRRALENELVNIPSSTLKQLGSNGYIELSPKQAQLRNMVVAKVLAISPYEQVVPRQKTHTAFSHVTTWSKWVEV